MLSLELCSYVEAEEFGVVAFLLEERLGDVDPERAERRNPVDADADDRRGFGELPTKRSRKPGAKLNVDPTGS